MSTVKDNTIELKQREFSLLEVLLAYEVACQQRRRWSSNIYNFNETHASVIEIYVAALNERSLQGSDIHLETIRGLGYFLENICAKTDDNHCVALILMVSMVLNLH